MKEETTVLIIVVAAAALLFWAVSSGLIKSGVVTVPGSGGVVAPQPSSNYSGYLAASTAPGVAGAINTVLSGLGNTVDAWLGGTRSAQPTAAGQTANAASPALAAQPAGPSPAVIPPSATYVDYSNALVGPQVDPAVAYAATTGAAFDYLGLAGANTADASYSLQPDYYGGS